jgi:hypothetical protein
MSEPIGEASQPPSEEDLRAAYEAELSRITASDMILQATVSLLNVGAYRVGSPQQREEGAPERDLEQARDAIDAAGALVKVLERRLSAKELASLRHALSRLQMAYAQAAPATGERQAAQRPASADPQDTTPKPGPAEASGRLWVPGG